MGKKSGKQPRIVSDAAAAFAATIFVAPARTPAAAREAYKVPCVWSLASNGQAGCKDTFDPNGLGSIMHTSCADGAAVMRAIAQTRKANGDAAAEAAREAAFAHMNAIRAEHGVKVAQPK